MKESDLYLPLKSYLENQNYEVKAEVNSCDVLAVKDDETLIVELKLSLNLDVILQAVDRLELSSLVYIGIPASLKGFKKKRKQLSKLLKMLGLGLILIDVKYENVEVLFDSKEYKPRKSKKKQTSLLKEFHERVGDPNLGGMSTKKGLVTAYKQKAIKIAKYLKENGATKASILSQEISEPKARDIMYKNYYEWFEKVSTGIYTLSEKGLEEINSY